MTDYKTVTLDKLLAELVPQIFGAKAKLETAQRYAAAVRARRPEMIVRRIAK